MFAALILILQVFRDRGAGFGAELAIVEEDFGDVADEAFGAGSGVVGA